jgi:inosose dehydratase
MDGGVSVRLATGPVSWGVDFAASPDNPPWREVLDSIGRSGYRWTELGPIGYLPEDPELLRPELERRGLHVAGSFVFEPLHRGLRLAEILSAARRACRAIRGAGGRFLVVIDLVDRERVVSAGRPEAAPRLSRRDWLVLQNGIEEVAEVACDEFGLRPVFHPHVGSWVEFEDEIERLLDALDPQTIGLCLDTGHCAYAGVDPVALYERHAARVEYLHLKDVHSRVLHRAVSEPLDFWTAISAGIFCPVGAGIVNFRALARSLERHGFDGPATVEQDRDARQGTNPLPDVVASRSYLEGLGLGEQPKARMA